MASVDLTIATLVAELQADATLLEVADLNLRSSAALERRAALRLEELVEALAELDRAICAVRGSLLPPCLEDVPVLTRATLDLALVHARRFTPAVKKEG